MDQLLEFLRVECKPVMYSTQGIYLNGALKVIFLPLSLSRSLSVSLARVLFISFSNIHTLCLNLALLLARSLARARSPSLVRALSFSLARAVSCSLARALSLARARALPLSLTVCFTLPHCLLYIQQQVIEELTSPYIEAKQFLPDEHMEKLFIFAICWSRETLPPDSLSKSTPRLIEQIHPPINRANLPLNP